MTGAFRKLVGVAVVAACGPETSGAEFEELCGAVGPHRLLALEGDATLGWAGVRRIGERVYLVVGTGEGEPIFGWPQPATSTVYSVGPCGEDPVVVAEDIDRVFAYEQWPGAVLGCRGGFGGDLFRLDPDGGAPSLLVAGGCGATATDRGLVRFESVDEATMRVLFYRYADLAAGETEPSVLLDAVRGDLYPFGYAFADEVLALDLAGDIVRVSLADGEVKVEQSGVFAFEASERWLVWQDLASTIENVEDRDKSPGDILLRDRETGDDVFIERRAFGAYGPRLRDDWLVLSQGFTDTVLIELPSRTVTAVPDGVRPFFRLPDGRWLAGSGFEGPWHLFDPSDGTTALLANETGALALSPDYLQILRVDSFTDDATRTEGQVRRYPFDGSGPELVARRATQGLVFWSDDHRIVTPVEVDAEWVGRLVIVEPGTLAERTIDERVHGKIAYAELSGDSALEGLLYVVRDGERSGVWVARPAE